MYYINTVDESKSATSKKTKAIDKIYTKLQKGEIGVSKKGDTMSLLVKTDYCEGNRSSRSRWYRESEER